MQTCVKMCRLNVTFRLFFKFQTIFLSIQFKPQIEFKWLTMCDMIDIKKRKFLEKFSISENSLCQVIVHMCNPR